MLDVYGDFVENTLAIPVVKGAKTADERFPGAVETYCIEAMMQDGKALQVGTSHFLGQNFAKAQDITFMSESGEIEHVWTTSWGVSTRLLGGLIMAHGDDDGLVVPPKVAPKQIVILPIFKTPEDKAQVFEFCEKLQQDLKAQSIRVHFDKRDMRGGEKSWEHIKKGVPLRVEVGPKDLAKNQVVVGFRNKDHKDKQFVSPDELVQKASGWLADMQSELLAKAKAFKNSKTKEINSLAEFEAFFEKGSGFALCHWNEAAIGHEILAKYKVTPRCVPIDGPEESGTCIFTGKPSEKRVIFAKAY